MMSCYFVVTVQTQQ